MSYNPPSDNSPKTRTEADTVAEVVRAGMTPIVNPCGPMLTMPHVIFPQTREVHSLERFLESPIRKRAFVTVRDYMSFISYVALHKETGTLIFAETNDQGGSFTARIDYHLGGDAHGFARWGDHVCKYVCEHSPEWKRWLEKSGKAMSQADMALFIEDNMVDIIDPEAARMLEMVKTLEATQGVEFKSLVRLNNGDRGLHYNHTTTAKAGQQGDIEIPEFFKIRVSVFQNGPGYDVQCKFRYRIKEGELILGFEVLRPHKIVELALTEARTHIVDALNPIPVLLGSALIGVPDGRTA